MYIHFILDRYPLDHNLRIVDNQMRSISLGQRIAIFSDIHGNATALEAVLKDIQQSGGVDAYWILGDLVAFGHAPVQTLEILAALPATTIISGNTDRFLVRDTQPDPTPEQVLADPRLFDTYTEVTRSLAWTQGAIAGNGWMDWLEKIPSSFSTRLDNGTRVMLVHASPGHDDGPALYPDLPENLLREWFVGKGADLIFSAHTHWAMEITIDNVHVVNVGSVGNPLAPDPRASWVCLDYNAEAYQLSILRTAYDYESVIRELNRLRHPGRRFLIRHLRGLQRPSSYKAVD
jgi:predicted phosphodiesterase